MRDLLYKVIRPTRRQNGSIIAEGVLEKLSDGYGFLRAPEASYLPGPDDIYVSPSQIRRFGLLTGDTSAARSACPSRASATSPWPRRLGQRRPAGGGAQAHPPSIG